MVKYICDCCEKEVSNKEDLHIISYLREMAYVNDGSLDESYKEICNECWVDFKLYCEDVFYKIIKERKDK